MSTGTLLNQSLPVKRIPFAIFLILQIILFLIVVLSPAKISLATVASLASLIFIIVYPDLPVAVIILSLIITIVLPRPTGRGLILKVEEIFPLVALLLLVIAFLQNETSNRSIGKIGYWLVAFLIVVLISGIIGILKEREKILIFDELMMFWAWGIYFIIVKSNLSTDQIKHILMAIIISALIVSLYYLFEFVMIRGMARFRTDQQHIFNFTIPLLFACMLYYPRKIIRAIAILLIIPMAIAVYVTLTRALWILVPLAIILQYFYFMKEVLRRTHLLNYLLPILVVVMVGILGFMLLQGLFSVSNLLSERFASFKILEYDVSLLARAELSRYVIEKVGQSPLFGVGLADFLRYQYFPTLGRFNVYWLDNTYMQLIWKTGIVGTMVFLILLYYFLRRAWFVLKNADTLLDKIIGSSVFFSFIALAISGLQCGILVGYRFNFVWAGLMAIVEIRAQEIEKSLNEIKKSL
ncbi:MAG: O-antigen ligase family protein [candidate division WOR-3 bacterium]|nr:O-antigen ligase family protein [candidate division WOR-3 bacterium]